MTPDERREPDRLTMGWMDWPPVDLRTPLERMAYLPLAVRMQPVTWPEVDAKRHPHKAERRARASRFNDLETTR